MNDYLDSLLKNIMYMTEIEVLKDKLKELMSEEDYAEFAKEARKETFYRFVDECPIPEIRNMGLDMYDDIVNGDD